MSERVFGSGDDSSKTAYTQTGTFRAVPHANMPAR